MVKCIVDMIKKYVMNNDICNLKNFKSNLCFKKVLNNLIIWRGNVLYIYIRKKVFIDRIRGFLVCYLILCGVIYWLFLY